MSKIFVFGSNLAGRHGKGAAAHAKFKHGAIYGIGEGMQGRSYAIPTKDENIKTLPLDKIEVFVDTFMDYAYLHPELEFQVTKIGCGLAGYLESQIAPMFRGASENCHLPDLWRDM